MNNMSDDLFDELKNLSLRGTDTFKFVSNSGTGYTYTYETDETCCYGYDGSGRFHIMFKITINDELHYVLIHQRYFDDTLFCIDCPSILLNDCIIRKHHKNMIIRLLRGEEIISDSNIIKIVDLLH